MAADVALDLVQAIDRQVELVLAGVLDLDVVARDPGELELLEPEVAADAAVLVHHGCADG